MVEVRGHRPREVVVAGFVAQLGTGGGIAYLGDLEESEQICHLETRGRTQDFKECIYKTEQKNLGKGINSVFQ